MNGFKVVLEIAIAFVIGAGILTVINWKTDQAISSSNQASSLPIELEQSSTSSVASVAR